MGDGAAADSAKGLVAAAITTTSAAVGASKRKQKLNYVELGEGGSTPDTSVNSSSSSGGGGGGEGGVAAGATSGEPEDKVSGRLAIFGLLNLGYVVVQLAGAMAFGSLALMSDGFHNLSDVAAIGMAMYIHRLQRRPCPENEDGGTDRLPFGYKRSEVIGGLMNSVALIALSAYIILSAIPRLVVPQEVTDGWLYISLAFGGVVINLVGVLFFWFPGEDGQSHDTHCGGFLAAHSHSHDHGHEAPVKLDSVGLLTLVDRYDVPPTAESSSACGGDDGEEISVILAGSDPIGRVSLNNTAVAREALLSGNGGGFEDVGGGREGGHACSHSHGGHHHHANGHNHHASGHNHHTNGHHQHANGHRLEEDRGNGHGDACCSHGGQNGGSHVHANGHVDNHALEMNKVRGKHGAAAVGGGCLGESHGHEHHVHGHHHDDVDSGGGDGCSHSHGHADGGGGCKGHGQSMNLMAVLVHAIADAVSSGVVCAQGVVAFIFGRSGVDWTDYLDPLTSIALSVFIVYCALPVVKECAHVLLEGTPRSADLPRLRKELSKVPGISKIQSLSVTQLNSEEPFVAAVTVVADPEVGGASTTAAEALENGGVGAAQTRRGGATGVVEAVKLILGSHNIGRNTVEVVLRHGDDAARGGATEGAPPNGNRETGRQSSGVESDGVGHEAKLGAGGSCNGSAGLEHDRRSHGQCSGHGHSHAHSSRAVDMV
ncbi:unnamed protein product [Ectocarpus sp. 12 AP-2014]